jgi:hypothetical protein
MEISKLLREDKFCGSIEIYVLYRKSTFQFMNKLFLCQSRRQWARSGHFRHDVGPNDVKKRMRRRKKVRNTATKKHKWHKVYFYSYNI